MLDTLPTELVEQIASPLDKKDLSSLRLVSRQLSLKSTPSYSDKWLRNLNSDLSQKSLLRLERIASHETFRHSPISLGISTWQSPLHKLGEDVAWEHNPFQVIDIASETVSRIRYCLVERLVRCRSMSISSGPPPRVKKSRPPPKQNTLSIPDVVRILLACVPGMSLASFTCSLDVSSLPGLPDMTGDVIRTGAFRASWAASLRTLHLSWQFKGADITALAADLIIAAAGLRDLFVSFGHYSAQPCLARLLAEDALPPLDALALFNGDVDLPTLVALVRRLGARLTTLRVATFNLSRGCWADYFRCLRRECPVLEHVQFTEGGEGWLSEGYEPFDMFTKSRFDASYFEAVLSAKGFLHCCTQRQGDPPVPWLERFTFMGKGDGMKLALETLEDAVSVSEDPWPQSEDSESA